MATKHVIVRRGGIMKGHVRIVIMIVISLSIAAAGVGQA